MDRMLPRPRFWAETALQMKTRLTIFGELLVFVLLYFIGSMVQSMVLSVPMSLWMLSSQGGSMLAALEAGASPQDLVLKLMENMPDWLAVVGLYGSAGLGAAALIYGLRFQKRKLSAMGLARAGAAGEYLLGLGVGLALFTGALAVGAALGGFHPVRGLARDGQPLLCLATLLGCLIQGASRELLIRGCFAPSVGARVPVPYALLMSTLISGMLETGGALLSMRTVNGLLLGLLLGIWAIKRGRIWSACAIHGVWSFAGSFLFGFAPAGEHGGIRLLDVDVDAYRPMLTGGLYGPQASICVTVVLLAALAVSLALKPRDPLPEQPEPGRA